MELAQLKDESPTEQCEGSMGGLMDRRSEMKLAEPAVQLLVFTSEQCLGAVHESQDDLGADASQFLLFLLHYKY